MLLVVEGVVDEEWEAGIVTAAGQVLTETCRLQGHWAHADVIAAAVAGGSGATGNSSVNQHLFCWKCRA